MHLWHHVTVPEGPSCRDDLGRASGSYHGITGKGTVAI